MLRLQRRLLVEHHHSKVGLLFELGVVARLPEMGLTQRVLQRLIQGTFGVIQGTSGVIQGTFGVIQGTSGAIQGTFGVILGTFNIPTKCLFYVTKSTLSTL